jgi:hypothetical protein
MIERLVVDALVIRKSVADATPVDTKDPVFVALRLFKVVILVDAEVKLEVEAVVTERLDANVPIAFKNVRLVVDAVVAKKLVVEALVKIVVDARNVPP